MSTEASARFQSQDFLSVLTAATTWHFISQLESSHVSCWLGCAWHSVWVASQFFPQGRRTNKTLPGGWRLTKGERKQCSLGRCWVSHAMSLLPSETLLGNISLLAVICTFLCLYKTYFEVLSYYKMLHVNRVGKDLRGCSRNDILGQWSCWWSISVTSCLFWTFSWKQRPSLSLLHRQGISNFFFPERVRKCILSTLQVIWSL